ncbi:hypothetical protein [Longivirga aurantiaca]|uniref:Uncharacterized protein n=1 Tax=Longivirga aurantiaca TaxID=1837743 RepID=A0ABW1T029_9ACTN
MRDRWHDGGLPLDHAYAVLVLARVLPAGGVPDEHIGEARAHLVGLGAVSLLRLIDAALESARSAQLVAAPAAPAAAATQVGGKRVAGRTLGLPG